MLASVPTPVAIVLVIAVGIALGSVPIANAVARHHGIADLRSLGDRNPGFWNANQLLGARRAAPILIGDTAKGAAAAAFGIALAAPDQWWLPYVGTGAAMVGHAWPIFAGLRGGRSVLAFVGGACVAAPVAGALAVAVVGVTWGVSKRFDWAVRVGFGAYPVIQLATGGPTRTAATGALMTLIGIRFVQAAIRSRIADRATPGGALPS